MANNEEKLEDSAGLMAILSNSEAPVRKRAALEEYIEQLETRIAVTDPARNPRYVARLKNEVKIATKELKTVPDVTESITFPQ